MSTSCSNKNTGLYETFASVNQSTNLENVYEHSEINIPKQKYVNIGDYKNINIGIPQTKEPSPSSIIMESNLQSESISPSVISYIGTPTINVKNETTVIANESEESISPQKWDGITTFYVSALSVIGLFVVFRAIQKSK